MGYLRIDLKYVCLTGKVGKVQRESDGEVSLQEMAHERGSFDQVRRSSWSGDEDACSMVEDRRNWKVDCPSTTVWSC